MIQIFLSNRLGATNEVVAVLAHGVYPGFKVVEDQDPIRGWDSRPKSKFRVIQVLVGDVSQFDDLMKSNIDDPLFPNDRLLIVDFLPVQAASIAQERVLIVANSAAVRRRPNPDVARRI